MGKIISFAWTTPAFVARRKTVTRRDWRPEYAARWTAGDLFSAYDRQPRHGGEEIGVGRLIATPYLQHVRDMPESDYEAEGFDYLEEHPELMPAKWKKESMSMRDRWMWWRASDERLWVVRFKVIIVSPSKHNTLIAKAT